MIRLVTVIGHGVNLVPHFIKHYRHQVDEIWIVIYESKECPNIEADVRDIIQYYHNVRIVKVHKGTSFHWNKVTELYNEVKNEHPNDWWVVADIDEFHMYPYDNLKDVVRQCDAHGWEIVRGGFIDRVGLGGTFPTIHSVDDLFHQFPMMGFFRYPMSNACPNKICIIKGYIELTPGQHYAKIDGHISWRWQGWNHPLIADVDEYTVQVHHFKWDSTCLRRIHSVATVDDGNAFSKEYQTMYNSLEENNFKVDVLNKEYMFEEANEYVNDTIYNHYKQWDKLIKKIITI